MEATHHDSLELPVMAKSKQTWFVAVVWCGWVLTLSGCFSRGQRVTPELASPPQLFAEEVAKQGENVDRPLAPDRLRFGLPPATLAALTDKVAQDMGWKEHFVLHEEREGSYTVVMSEGTTLGVQRRVSITPADIGSEVLIFPPDEGIAARLREQFISRSAPLTRQARTRILCRFGEASAWSEAQEE